MLESTDTDIPGTLEELGIAVKKTLLDVNGIWNELGVTGVAKTDRLKKFKSHILALLADMQDEEEKNKVVVIEKIERYMKEAASLKKELDLQNNIKADLYQGTKPLFQVEMTFREELRKLQHLKDERLQELEKLQRKEEKVLWILGQQNKKFQHQAASSLSVKNIQAFRTYIETKEFERDELQSVFEDTQQSIRNIFDELELQPQLPFEKEVVASPANAFILSTDNMMNLKKLHQSMEQKLTDAKDEATELREKLSALWERLQICSEERAAFLEKHPGHSIPTIQAIKKEVKRCEELKAANIALFLGHLREELISWWDRCRFSNEQRNAFTAFHFSECTEDMLDMFELEVAKMRQYYEDNRDIFALADKRNELWEKMCELEARANDPNRLFTNRGGQLLKEEKERKLIQKELPRIEQALLKLLEEYEDQNRSPFLLDGYNLAEFIKTQWNERNDNKECVKLQRKVTKSTQLTTESKLGSKLTPNSHMRGNGTRTPIVTRSQLNLRSAPSHLSVLKRKADDSFLSPGVSKKTKDRSKSSEKKSSKSRPRYSISKVRRFGKGATRRLDDSSKEKIRLNRSRRNIMGQLPINESTSYSEFQNHLEAKSSKQVCRSSTLPQRCLRERNPHASVVGGAAPFHQPAHPGMAPYPQSPYPGTAPYHQSPYPCSSSVSTTTKLTLTPAGITSAMHFTLTADTDPALSRGRLLVTPVKPPRRNGGASGIPTPRRTPHLVRSSTRLNVKSPGKSPASITSSRLTTPRGQLPILF